MPEMQKYITVRDLRVVSVWLSVYHYVIKTDCFLEENELKMSLSVLRTVTFRFIFLESQFNQAIEQKKVSVLSLP